VTEPNQVVARLTNGTVVKGLTRDFFPNRSTFHVTPLDQSGPITLRLTQLKAVFFVRDLIGIPDRLTVKRFDPDFDDPTRGKKVAIRFNDGELLCGYTLGYSPKREGFFVVPVDLSDNNLRIFVVAEAVAEIGIGPVAETMIQSEDDRAA